MPDNSLTIKLGVEGEQKVTSAIERIKGNLGLLAGATLAAAAIAAAAAAIERLTKAAIDNADAMGKMAQKAGVAVEQFSALAYAGSLAGVSTEQLVTAAKGLNTYLQRTGQTGADLIPVILKIAGEFENMADGQAKVNRAIQVFGKSGQEMIPLLNSGTEALKAQFEEAQKFGQVIGGSFARNAETFNDNLTRMKALFTGVWNQVAERVLPTLIALTEQFLEFAKNSGIVQVAVTLLAGVIDVFSELVITAGEAWITFTGILKGDSFGKVGERLLQFNEQIDELRNKLANPLQAATAKGSLVPDGFDSIEQFKDFNAKFKAFLDERFAIESSANAARQAINDQANKDNLAIHDDFLLKKDQKDEFYAIIEKNRLLKLAKFEDQLRKQNLQGIASTLSTTAGLFGNLSSALAGQGKKTFGLVKTLRAAEVIMNTAAGITRTFADFPYPVAIAFSSLIAVTGALQLANIASQKPPQAHGGMDFIPSEQTFLLSRGERVLQPSANEDLTQFLRNQDEGGSSTVLQLVIDGKVLGAVNGQLSRDGRMTISQRAIVT